MGGSLVAVCSQPLKSPESSVFPPSSSDRQDPGEDLGSWKEPECLRDCPEWSPLVRSPLHADLLDVVTPAQQCLFIGLRL